MYPTLIEYLGFIVAALILGWAILEISRRYLHQLRVDSMPMNTWVTLDSTFEDDGEKSSAAAESDEEEESLPEAKLQIRAQHNGYHSESKKLL